MVSSAPRLMPRAPAWILPLAATTIARGGDREERARHAARGCWTRSERYIQRAAERGLLQLRALDEIDQLQFLVDRYAIDHAVASGELDRSDRMPGCCPAVPVDPLRVPYVYDPATHRVSLSPRSPLATAAGRPGPPVTTTELVLLGVFGLMIGSFLNVCISRLPAGESVVDAAAHIVDRAATPIRAFDNVPVRELPGARRPMPVVPRADRLAIPAG